MQRRRQWIMALLMVSLVFAQAVTAAHACSILAPGSQGLVQADTPTMPVDCNEMAQQSGSTVNVCESHCVFGQQVDVYTDASTAALAPQLALTIRLSDPTLPASAERSSLLASAAAPPPLLLFSRFLI